MAAVASGHIDPAASIRIDPAASGRVDPAANGRIDGVYLARLMRCAAIIRSDPRIASRARPLRLSACKGSMPTMQSLLSAKCSFFTALSTVEPTAEVYLFTNNKNTGHTSVHHAAPQKVAS